MITLTLPADSIGDYGALTSAVLALVSLVFMLVDGRWHKTPWGRQFFAYVLVTTVIMCQLAIAVILRLQGHVPLEIPWYQNLRATAYLSFPIVLGWRIWRQMSSAAEAYVYDPAPDPYAPADGNPGRRTGERDGPSANS